MSPLLIQPIRPIKPISFAQSMQRAKEGDRSQDWISQMPTSNSMPVSQPIVPQLHSPELSTVGGFARFSTLALVKMLPPRSMPPARLQDYTAMASSNDEDEAGVGQLFDMHA